MFKNNNQTKWKSYIDLGCSKPGVYGNNCDIKCPINCENNTCNIEIGTCLSCKPGWTGKFCKQGICGAVFRVLCF